MSDYDDAKAILAEGRKDTLMKLIRRAAEETGVNVATVMKRIEKVSVSRGITEEQALRICFGCDTQVLEAEAKGIALQEAHKRYKPEIQSASIDGKPTKA